MIFPPLLSWVSYGGVLLSATHADEKSPSMFRVLILLFWISLLTGTLLAHNIVANWAVTLTGLYFLVRWRSARRRDASTVARTAAETIHSDRAPQRALGETAVPPSAPARSRWTVDRVHSADRGWR
jgi:hypothetical protein